MSERSDPRLDLAEAVREACVRAAIEGYDNAAISGLCHEGAVEASVSAIRMVDLKRVVEALGES
jgi:hypothetical protein